MERPISGKEVEELKECWRALWRDRIDDKVRAEGVSSYDYPELFVDRGTIIFATRDFRPLNFRKILEKHGMVDVDRFVAPSPEVGGWGRFISTIISGLKRMKSIEETRRYLEKSKKKQHVRKDGHGWLRV